LSGENEAEDSGQLAVMDAVVFFAGAILISAGLLSLPGQIRGNSDTNDATIDVARLLDTVLASSIGTNLTMDTGRPVTVSRQALVRDCLAFEGEFLIRGGEPEVFAELNLAVTAIFDGCAPAGMDAYLLLVYRSCSEPLLALPHLPDEEATRAASSVELTLDDGLELLIVLVLSPSAPSELD